VELILHFKGNFPRIYVALTNSLEVYIVFMLTLEVQDLKHKN